MFLDNEVHVENSLVFFYASDESPSIGCWRSADRPGREGRERQFQEQGRSKKSNGRDKNRDVSKNSGNRLHPHLPGNPETILPGENNKTDLMLFSGSPGLQD